MVIRCVWEHNGEDTLLYSDNFPGAYTRGETKEIAMQKMEGELISFLRWARAAIPTEWEVEIVQEKESSLQISDADSDVLFDSEKRPLCQEDYLFLKEITLKSAADFQKLYDAIPDKNKSVLQKRKTFYGLTPATAQEMYDHTKGVNSYYFEEIGVDADHEGSILECRKRGFALLEKTEGYLDNPVFHGSYGEDWTLLKLFRRFLWHDRIHAKAMYRMAKKTFPGQKIEDVFRFDG